MDGERLEAIGKMMMAEIGQLVKAAEAGARSGQVVALAGMEEQVQQVMRRGAGQALGLIASAVREGAELEVRCQCGQLCRYKGEQGRQQETLVGQLRYRRGYYYCRQCGRGRYPVDEAMAMAPGQFSRKLQEAMALAGTLEAFGPAAKRIKSIVGIVVSASTVQRVTEGCGAMLEARQAQERQRLLAGEEPSAVECEQTRSEGQHWVVEFDAAKGHFRDDWHEVKVGVVCLAQRQVGEEAQEQGKVKAVRASYTTHVGSVDDAGAKLYAEAVRRGIRPWQDTVVCLADGAPSNWNQFALHFPLRVEILDWYHAMEHVWAAGKAGLGEGTDKTKAWVEQQETLLWQGSTEAVIEAVEALARTTALDVVAREGRYLRTNQERINYARFREQGYPIGSGAVESACKRLVGARLKGPGMRWTAAGAQAVLNLCAALAGERWEQDWPLTRPMPMAA